MRSASGQIAPAVQAPLAGEAVACVVQAATVRLLAGVRPFVTFSAAASLLALAALLLPPGWPQARPPWALAFLAGSLLPGLAALYYGFRVRLDADLFALLGPPGPVSAADFAAGIDLFRARLTGGLTGRPSCQAPPAQAGADNLLAPRLAGALRLWRRLLFALGLQGALLAGAAGASCWAALAGG